jgi:hypothetical protein
MQAKDEWARVSLFWNECLHPVVCNSYVIFREDLRSLLEGRKGQYTAWWSCKEGYSRRPDQPGSQNTTLSFIDGVVERSSKRTLNSVVTYCQDVHRHLRPYTTTAANALIVQNRAKDSELVEDGA